MEGRCGRTRGRTRDRTRGRTRGRTRPSVLLVLAGYALALVECAAQGWTRFGSHHYKLIDSKQTWSDARASCTLEGADMVTIKSAEEQEFVVSLMPTSVDRWQWLWIGMAKDPSTGAVSRNSRWIDGSAVTYSNWDGNQALTSTDGCAEIYGGTAYRWHDNACNVQSRTVCKRSALAMASPPETTRSYSSVWQQDPAGTGYARSTVWSAQAWTAMTQAVGEWMQIDLGAVAEVRGVVVQGHRTSNEWVTLLKVTTSLDGSSWGDMDGGKNFVGSSDRDTMVRITFAASTPARFVRLLPQDWHSRISMRAAVLVRMDADAAAAERVCLAASIRQFGSEICPFVLGNDVRDRSNVDGARGFQFVDTSKCFESAGFVTKVKMYIGHSRSGRMQIYTPAGGSKYTLKAESEEFELPTGVQTKIFAAPMVVAAGDCVGWYHSGAGFLDYDNTVDGNAVRWNSGRKNVGTIVDFNGSGGRTYSYEVVVRRQQLRGAASITYQEVAGRACAGRNEIAARSGISLDDATAHCNSISDCVSFENLVTGCTNSCTFQFSTSCTEAIATSYPGVTLFVKPTLASLELDAAIDLDLQTEDVEDGITGAMWTLKGSTSSAPVLHEGVKCRSVEFLRRSSDSAPTVPQHYTQAYWINWRVSDTGWRTLFRMTRDHGLIVQRNSKTLGMYSNRDGSFRDAGGYQIIPGEWQFVVATGVGDSATSSKGAQRYYVASCGQSQGCADTPSFVDAGASDRVISGTKHYQLGWSGQGPGYIARAMLFDKVLSTAEMVKVYQATRPAGVGGPVATAPKAVVDEQACLAAVTLESGSWDHVPTGCSVHSFGDWTAHYNRLASKAGNGEYARVTDAAVTPRLPAGAVFMDGPETVGSTSLEMRGMGIPFFFQAEGANNCPVDMVIATETECRAAASIHGSFAKVVTAGDRPAGCFWDQNGRTYFNADLQSSATWAGVGGLCKRNSKETVLQRWFDNDLPLFIVKAGGRLSLRDMVLDGRNYEVSDNGGAIRTEVGEDESVVAPVVILENVKFINFRTKKNGGAIFVSDAQVHMARCAFYNNHAAQNGGAIANFRGFPVLAGVTFSSNQGLGETDNIYNTDDSDTKGFTREVQFCHRATGIGGFIGPGPLMMVRCCALRFRDKH